MTQPLLVVMQNIEDDGQSTIYPEVHHVYTDDTFVPALDAAECKEGNISLIVDLDESAEQIVSYKSLSPDWQILECNMHAQSLAGCQKGLLISITGSSADSPAPTTTTNPQDLLEKQIKSALRYLGEIERRNALIRQILNSPVQ